MQLQRGLSWTDTLMHILLMEGRGFENHSLPKSVFIHILTAIGDDDPLRDHTYLHHKEDCLP